ncbi:hypothetical protein LTR56_005409 [Elasticomyces elasticus]|nr:hypothetical protein LTR22_020640 [Elasticomyces elasticus]KAK3651900.1 hypothetical protein LTR56_005409 [Elasticomyces elasticus]KAK4927795.1 hypothetical protein LTR49_005421 [Elasticomyces elasticus]KAK5761466.1 hypothetical protein LTS12_008429 [Elasticomyces elasticus]
MVIFCSEHQVFGLPELLEAVLVQVANAKDIRTIFQSQRICKTFNHTIKTSPTIRKLMFLEVDDDATTEPTILSPIITTLRLKNLGRRNRTAYIDTGKNLWRVTRCDVIRRAGSFSTLMEGDISLTVESMDKRGRRASIPQRSSVSSAMETFVSSKAVTIKVGIEFVDASGEEAETVAETDGAEILKLSELMELVDDEVAEWNSLCG